jgi:hypothetical protein
MPVYMEISRLHRTVTIVARGTISPDEIRGVAQQLADANVRSFAKIVEVAGATTEWTPEQVARVAQLLRGASSEKRGPVAFIIDPDRTAFPKAFAERPRAKARSTCSAACARRASGCARSSTRRPIPNWPPLRPRRRPAKRRGPIRSARAC